MITDLAFISFYMTEIIMLFKRIISGGTFWKSYPYLALALVKKKRKRAALADEGGKILHISLHITCL